MSAFLLRPFTIEIANVLTPSGGSAAALLNPQPRVVWETPAVSGVWVRWLDIDLGADREFDT